jgi:hypothetical protein
VSSIAGRFTLAAEYDVVDVFVGTFDSQEVLEQYLEETYDQDEEDAPISAFAKDQGEAFYDHDFVESRFEDSAKSFIELGKRLPFQSSGSLALRNPTKPSRLAR